MLGYVPFPTITQAPYVLSLAPYSFLWLELQPPNAKTEPLPEHRLEEVEDNTTNQFVALGLLARDGRRYSLGPDCYYWKQL